ncbi:class D sortase [Anaerobacillus sp. MEB173]|uniref:class D sortase n=1 Tax=Anaerobacillus sp. MEB173 TaxID=3383345 RepID=UPI003F912A35
MKKMSFLLICLGVTVIGFNFYSIQQGISASSKPEISVGDFEMKKEVPMIEQGASKDTAVTEQKLYKKIPDLGEQIGVLTIPKLDRSLPIYHGTTKEVLKKGVGHYDNGVMPGENNNTILSGHRDTVFRGFGQVGINDRLIVSTDAGEFLYKVRKVKIVDKDDRTVIVPKPKSTLTITTCYPFGYIGDAPQRYIVVGELISKNDKFGDVSIIQTFDDKNR